MMHRAPSRGESEQARQAQAPPGGYVDNPAEVNNFLSQEHLLELSYTDIRNLSSIEESDSNRNKREKNAHDKVEDLLSKKMLQTSLEDRNAIVGEIHGIQNLAPEESSEMIDAALSELDKEISNVPPRSRQSFDRSQDIAPNGYINSSDFRLRFLRCELFDAKRAANRMVQFLDVLSELFGDVVLKRPVMMKDFSKEEMQAFRVGHQQLLPYRDRSGRRVFACVGGVGLDVPLLTRVKILIYIILAASEDVETQRKGIISVIWPGTNTPSADKKSNVKLDRIMFMKRIYGNLPLRTCSIHFCSPNNELNTPFLRVFRTLTILTMPHYLGRLKFHAGEPIELLYSLKTFGIPAELIPITDTGNIKTIYLKQWMKLRRIIDNAQAFSDHAKIDLNFIECPGLNDVIFRTGTSLYCHPGNVRFRCLMEQKHEIPSYIIQKTRSELAAQIIEETEAEGGKFLKWDQRNMYWTPIEQSQVQNKVLLAIRDFKYKSKIKRAHLEANQDKSFMFLNGKEHNANEMCLGTAFRELRER